TIEVSSIPGTLRYNFLQNVAANDALNSVPEEDNQNCINPSTNKKYTYSELNKKYEDAKTVPERQSASQLIKSCSALRVIPDALPAFYNEEALLASLNKLFHASGWEPQSLSPSGSSSGKTTTGAKPISVSLAIEADSGTTMNVLNSIERSIREFNIDRATIEWGKGDILSLHAQANAYYVDPSTIKEETKTIKAEAKK
ncbi:hypothetical protein IKE83_02495, partial [Candidatus Saccharibacteria bacterium]|nr:hypothetical protein [Candidatus Saccharibacteria bacterium]